MWLFGSRLFGCFAVAALHPAVRLFGSRLPGCFAVAALHLVLKKSGRKKTRIKRALLVAVG